MYPWLLIYAALVTMVLRSLGSGVVATAGGPLTFALVVCVAVIALLLVLIVLRALCGREPEPSIGGD